MSSILILNATIVNEGKTFESDLFIENGIISRIDKNLSSRKADKIIDLKGQHLLPGVIDDQVHFREPGLTHKATIHSEARAAVAGGTTSYMEMPNTVPNAVTQVLLEDKYKIAANTSLANYSFFMGATNDNTEEVLETDPKKICGVKVFMGSSTGNMLVDNEKVLENIFKNSPTLIATHCEDEATIKKNIELYKQKYGNNISPDFHAEIRSVDACYKSSSMAVELAKKNGTRLHILHISTEKEISLFRNDIPLKDKRITAEVCIHHLWFDRKDYARLGNLIKWNPSIKEENNKKALFQALLDDRLDIIATDHAPHTWEEKSQGYWQAPSGGPLVQHSLNAMLEFYHEGKISLEKVVEKMAHAPAICFQVEKRGFIREGYWADLVAVDLNSPWMVDKSNIYYQCGWSALEGTPFRSRVLHTIVSGHVAFSEGKFDESVKGERLSFER
jgi:dihydroorotase